MKNKKIVDLNAINIDDLYDMLCTELSFNEVIKLYKLLKYKIENLDDKPKETIYCYNKDRKEIEVK